MESDTISDISKIIKDSDKIYQYTKEIIGLNKGFILTALALTLGKALADGPAPKEHSSYLQNYLRLVTRTYMYEEKKRKGN